MSLSSKIKSALPISEKLAWALMVNPVLLPSRDEAAGRSDRISRLCQTWRLADDSTLSLGYLRTYQGLIKYHLPNYLAPIRKIGEEVNLHGWSPELKNFWAVSIEEILSQALALFDGAHYSLAIERLSAFQVSLLGNGSLLPGADPGQFGSILFALGWFHPQRTNWGIRYPYVEKGGVNFRFLEIDATRFPRGYDRENYWNGLTCRRFWYGEVVGGQDVPLDEEPPRPLPTVADPDHYEAQSDRLLEEGLAHKRRAIPTGAIVQQPFGPLKSFEVHEVGNDICFVGRDPDARFVLAYLVRQDDGAWRFICDSPLFFPSPPRSAIVGSCQQITSSRDESDIKGRRSEAVALRYVLSLIVRDFWVLEERELRQVFTDGNPKRVPGIRISQMADGSPRVVYLPRIVYLGGIPREAVKRVEESLKLGGRTFHLVREHLRQSPRCTERATLLAQSYGLTVLTGYTFVRPHTRGDTGLETVYRSRSALACVYKIQPETRTAVGLRGLEFQSRVANGLEARGYHLLSISNSLGGPDGGVDIHAVLDRTRFAFQVKEKGPGKRVDVDEIRIFADSVRDLPEDTVAIFVTNEGYTKPATSRAQARGILLWGGSEVERLVRNGH